MKRGRHGSLTLPLRSHDTILWKGIMSIYNVLIANTSWNVGRGDKLNFWHDSWCGDDNLKSMFPITYLIAQNKNLLVCDASNNAGQCLIAVSRNLND